MLPAIYERIAVAAVGLTPQMKPENAAQKGVALGHYRRLIRTIIPAALGGQDS
jgi:hypothetical protein